MSGLDPQIAKDLIEKFPQGKEFVAFLAEKASELNTINNLPNSDLLGLTDPEKIAIELKGRQRAYQIIIEILDPLLNTSKGAILKPNSKEYSVDVS